MSTKSLILLLAVLFCLPMGLVAKEGGKRTISKRKSERMKVITRVPLTFDFIAEEIGNSLQIVFIGRLPDSEVIVTDRDGNIVWEEQKVSVYDGKTICIQNAEAYPYLLKVDSPVVEATGEIILEDVN